MKAKSWLYVFLLIVWMGGSTYWYVCKIKNDCQEAKKEEPTKTLIIAQKKQQEIDIENAKSKTRENLDKIKALQYARLTENLTAGYTVSGFPLNATENHQIKDGFEGFAKDLKQYVSENKEAIIELTGHTDNIGSEQTNLILGKKRVGFIKAKLIEAGIPEQNIVVRTKGESKPAQSNTTAAGRAKNRRVEIKLSKN